MNKLLVIVGPTGTGKTKLALKLAKEYNGELVSADSRQVYKELDIATGKEVDLLKNGKAIKGEGYWEVDGIKINLYDVLDPKDTFSVAAYQQLAVAKINEIQKKGNLPILVGGTGLYVSSVTDGLKIPKTPPDPKLREHLQTASLDELYEKLKKVDPETASQIDANNPRRLTRALEIYYQTGEKMSEVKAKYKPDFDMLFIGLTTEREKLYENADHKVDEWLKLGLEKETESLLKKYSSNLPSMSSIGYRQIGMSLDKKISLSEAVQRIKFDLHSYIRRQLTWFKRDGRINWFDINEENSFEEIGKLFKEWYNKKQ